MILIVLATQLYSQSGMPQGGMPPNGMKPDFEKKMSSEEMLEKMTVELQLNDLQQLQVREILKDMEKTYDFNPSKTKSSERPNFQEMKEKREAIKSELTAKLTKILSYQQLKKWSQESDNWKPIEE